jgi:hypothetical protein
VRGASAEATIDDWLELLGLDEVIGGLLAGTATLETARDEVAAARGRYPGVAQDYVAVLDLVDEALDEVEAAIDAQQRAIADFNRAMADVGETFPAQPGRLLTEQERARLAELRDAALAFFGQLKSRQLSLAAEAEELQVLMESLQSGLDEGIPGLEDEVGELAEQLQELTEAMEASECLP